MNDLINFIKIIVIFIGLKIIIDISVICFPVLIVLMFIMLILLMS